MTSALGLGGLLAGRLRLDRATSAAAATVAMSGCGIVLVAAPYGLVVIGAQVVLALLLVTIGIHLTRLMHDATPSTVRSGVASGISTLSWLTFLPCSLLFGVLSEHGGVRAAGWIITALVAVSGSAVVAISRRANGPDPVGVPALCAATS
jgi:hypothetical protein